MSNEKTAWKAAETVKKGLLYKVSYCPDCGEQLQRGLTGYRCHCSEWRRLDDGKGVSWEKRPLQDRLKPEY